MLSKIRPWLGMSVPIAFMAGLLVMSDAMHVKNAISWLCVLLHTAGIAVYDALQVQWHRTDDMELSAAMSMLMNAFASMAWGGLCASKCFDREAVPAMLITLGIMSAQLLIGAVRRHVIKSKEARKDAPRES